MCKSLAVSHLHSFKDWLSCFMKTVGDAVIVYFIVFWYWGYRSVVAPVCPHLRAVDRKKHAVKHGYNLKGYPHLSVSVS